MKYLAILVATWGGSCLVGYLFFEQPAMPADYLVLFFAFTAGKVQQFLLSDN
jgi:hypothetical protein